MEPKQKMRKVVVSMLALGGLLAFSLLAIGGTLQPSAPPGPTMKTLDEVEPRIPIRAADLPLVITEPNSYYLVEDVNFTDTANNAITIECNDVTIDLMGYTLRGQGSAGKDGIFMNGATNVEIRNGTVRGFSDGIYETSTAARQYRIINVRAMSNAYYGIRLRGYYHLVKDCTALENGDKGIREHDGSSTVTGNTCYDNGDDGISAHYDSTVKGNTSYNNGRFGIFASNCTVTDNMVRNNGSIGIMANASSTVTGNMVHHNTGSGITVSSGCGVTDNTCNGNGYYGDGAGIHATANKNHVERNNIAYNDRGIEIDDSGNYIADNTVKDNTDNYDIAAGNQLNIVLCEVPETIDWPATVTLAGSLTCSVVDAHGITVEANDVTIDLAGFALIGPDSGNGNGIYMNGWTNVEIRNGTVRDFRHGIGEDSAYGKNHRIINVRAVSNQEHGIWLSGRGHLVKDCTAGKNSGWGIWTIYGSTVTGNTSYNNNSGGIYTNVGSTVTGNTSFNNGGDGIYTVSGCTVAGNTVKSNGDEGICASHGSTVTGNTVCDNTGDGIQVSYYCRVTDNTCNNNGDDGDGAGIHAFNNSNRIEQNIVTGNDRGIDVDQGGNLIVKNSAFVNGTNYSLTGDNAVGAIISSTGTISADPWANFSF